MSDFTLPVKNKLLGLRISITTPAEIIELINFCFSTSRKIRVNYINVHGMNLLVHNPRYHEVLDAAEVVFCDGVGVKLASRLLDVKLGDRMTPPDWIGDAFNVCLKQNAAIYVIGDDIGVAEQFIAKALENHPGLRFVGYHHGFFDPEGAENDLIVDEIKASDADLIITGMGMPRQEIWAHETFPKLDKGVFLATGALFRWYTGIERRSPRWVTDNGLEWLARLIQQPCRHFRRYVIGNSIFMFRVIREAFLTRVLNCRKD